VVRVETDLYPGGRRAASAVLITPLIQGSDDIMTGYIRDVFRTRWADRDVVIKRYNHISLVHSLRDSVGRSRAGRSWRSGRRLCNLGIPTPRPLACIDEYKGLLVWRSYLVTEYVDGTNLEHVLNDEHVSAGRKRRLVHQTLRLMNRVAQHNISYGDMKHANIRCIGDRIVLTDLDGMEVASMPWLRQRGGDTAGFLSGVAGDRDCEDGTGRHDGGRPRFVKLRRNGCHLSVSSAFRMPDLEDGLLAGPEAVRQRFQAEPVCSASSSRVHRFVAIFDGMPRMLYLKEYLHRSWLDRVKHWFRRDRAVRSAWASRMLQEHGFEAPEVVAVGEIWSGLAGSTAFTVTLAIAGTEAIDRYFMDGSGAVARSLRERRLLLRQFGQIVGRMHRDGIAHGDLRLGNVLVRNRDGRWEFFFIDNERTRKFSRLPDRLRLKNLVQICFKSPRGLSRTDRMRFFIAYWGQAAEGDWHRNDLVRKVIEKTEGRMGDNRRIRREMQRRLTTCDDCLEIRTRRYTGVFYRDFCQETDVAAFVERIDAQMDAGQIIKRDEITCVSRLTWNKRDIVVKRYSHQGLLHALRHTIKKSRARRAWTHAHRLQILGIGTPRVLGFLERREGPLVWQSYLITEYTDAPTLQNVLRDDRTTDAGRAEARRQVIRLLHEMDKYRITHGDLKDKNILITQQGPWLMDLDSMKVHRSKWYFRIERKKDRARLDGNWQTGACERGRMD
jgi:tRNA A-37 threonylcarbamoyl transferase component Bud32